MLGLASEIPYFHCAIEITRQSRLIQTVAVDTADACLVSGFLAAVMHSMQPRLDVETLHIARRITCENRIAFISFWIDSAINEQSSITKLTDDNEIATMRQRNARCFCVEIFSIFILKLFRNQFQFAHFRSMKRPCSRHDKSRMNGSNIVPFFLASAFAGEFNDWWHLERIFFEAIWNRNSLF